MEVCYRKYKSWPPDDPVRKKSYPSPGFPKSKANTRNAAAVKFNIPKHTTTKYEQSPLYRTITAWNAVPSTIETGDVKKHKRNYQRLLINKTH